MRGIPFEFLIVTHRIPAKTPRRGLSRERGLKRAVGLRTRAEPGGQGMDVGGEVYGCEGVPNMARSATVVVFVGFPVVREIDGDFKAVLFNSEVCEEFGSRVALGERKKPRRPTQKQERRLQRDARWDDGRVLQRAPCDVMKKSGVDLSGTDNQRMKVEDCGKFDFFNSIIEYIICIICF